MGTHFIHGKDIFERGPHDVYRRQDPGPLCCLTSKSNMAAQNQVPRTGVAFRALCVNQLFPIRGNNTATILLGKEEGNS